GWGRLISPARAVVWPCRAPFDNDAHAQRKDVPDLVRFLLGTGCRIGEALAVHWRTSTLTVGSFT
ncbi:hypothetical protein, partial [Oryzihumus leptocrescens]|uniref:hypothetical protein n=1 Tax=Oryzihumus leptocrescens TaxID=297536 RepID=UPI003CD069E0